MLLFYLCVVRVHGIVCAWDRGREEEGKMEKDEGEGGWEKNP